MAAAFDFEGLNTIEELLRLLEIATMDTLSLENSIARNRTLATITQAHARLLETGEQEERLTGMEAVLGPRLIDGLG